MLHRQIHRGYRQTLFLPGCAPTPDTVVHVDVLGRLRGTGHFDLHQVSARHVVHVVQSGRGEVTYDDVRYEVSAGDVFCFYPGDRIHYREERRDPWRYTWFGLLGPIAGARLEALGFSVCRVRHAAVRGPQMWQRFDAIEAAFTTERHGPCWASAVAWELLDLLHDHDGAVSVRDPVAALARIVEAGYDRGVRIEDLARDLGIDRSTLFRRFRASYGCSPRQWLMQVRLERARDLLLRGELTVADVANRSGFHDARGFARAFHARYGSPPGALRRQRKLSVK